jgi:hypothetical protein
VVDACEEGVEGAHILGHIFDRAIYDCEELVLSVIVLKPRNDGLQ